MCGIAGIISVNAAAISTERLQQMMHALAHRGPDGEGLWINPDASTGLAHRRLSIIDLSPAGNQPLLYGDRLVIIHNGEIYNYIELRSELEQYGYHFRSRTDTEVIAAAYLHWKEDCLEKLEGMFAFAIWDEQEKTLFAARDRFGEKPFFFYRDKERFVFASEMKALWEAGISKRMNYRMLFNFITIGYTANPEDPQETFYEGIQKLPAAHYLLYRVREKEPEIINYWDVETENINTHIKEAEAVEQFRLLLSDSVAKRLRSDVPVGTSLSGGLDSSAIASLCSRQKDAGHSFAAFTAVFPGFNKDEEAYADLVNNSFGLTPHKIHSPVNELPSILEKVIESQEEPFGSASIIAQYKVYAAASAAGVKVLLDGQGADEILAGYHKYYKWYWQELFAKRKLLRSGELKAAKTLGVKESFGWKNIIASLFPDTAAAMLERQYLIRALQQPDLSRDFIRLHSKEAYYTTPDIFSLNGALYFNTVIHGLEELLRFADRNSMAHGVEVRLPFLSHQLVEFVFSLPSSFKIHQGWTKWLLRQTMDKQLPDAITWRKDKTGFEPPQKEWMQLPAMQSMISDARQKLVQAGVLSKSVLQKPLQPHDAHAAEAYDWRYLVAAQYL